MSGGTFNQAIIIVLVSQNNIKIRMSLFCQRLQKPLKFTDSIFARNKEGKVHFLMPGNLSNCLSRQGSILSYRV